MPDPQDGGRRGAKQNTVRLRERGRGEEMRGGGEKKGQKRRGAERRGERSPELLLLLLLCVFVPLPFKHGAFVSPSK